MTAPERALHLPVLSDQQGWLLAALEALEVAASYLELSAVYCARSHASATRALDDAYRAGRLELNMRRHLLMVELACLDSLSAQRGMDGDPMRVAWIELRRR